MERRSQDCIFPREIQKVTGADIDFDLVKMAQDFCWVLGVGASTVSSLPPAPFLREVIPPGLCSCSHSQHSCTWSEKVPVLTCLEKKNKACFWLSKKYYGQQDGFQHKGVCHQAGWPEFNPWDSNVARKLSSDFHTHRCTKWINECQMNITKRYVF